MNPSAPARARFPWTTAAAASATLVAAGALAGCAAGAGQPDPSANPSTSLAPAPNYGNVCAPVGADTSTTCLRVTLQAIDAARAAEGLGPMRLPADFGRLSVPEQLFVAVDRERVDRGLAPFAGLSAALDQGAHGGRIRPSCRHARGAGTTRWSRSGSAPSPTGSMPTTSGCTTTAPAAGPRAARADRHRAAGPTATSSSAPTAPTHLVMGAAYDPTGDTSPGDRGGSSLAATLAVGEPRRRPLRVHLGAGAWPRLPKGRCTRCAPCRRPSPTAASPTRRAMCPVPRLHEDL